MAENKINDMTEDEIDELIEDVYEEVYDDTNTDRMYESITITCRQLTVTGKGSVEYDNHWAL